MLNIIYLRYLFSDFILLCDIFYIFAPLYRTSICLFMELRIKDVIKFKGVTAVWLASQIGITQPNMSNIVSGKTNPSLDTLGRIAAALNVPVVDLFVAPSSGFIICPKCGTAIKLTAESASND